MFLHRLFSRRLLSYGISILTLVLILDFNTAQPVQASTRRSFESAPCSFAIPQGLTINCGFLSVPEDRSDTKSKMIRLAVAVIKSKNPHPKPDPVVYLQGGPGGVSLRFLETPNYLIYAPFINDRDFIMFDQRGTGFSTPVLDCPEQRTLAYRQLNTNPASFGASSALARTVQNCHDDLVKQGIKLASYTSVEDANDVDDLRVSLGYPAWNLYGISYGTRLALVVMRDHPEGVRSVVLDSSYPLQLTVGQRSFDTVLEVMFAGCEKDPACAATYPNLRKNYRDLINRLDRQPVSEYAVQTQTNRRYQVMLTGVTAHLGLFQAMYSSKLIPYLPKFITDAYNGKYVELAKLVLDARATTETYINRGMEFSVNCGDRFGLNFGYEALCRTWGVPADKLSGKPVVSNLPTLVLQGEYDPVTPPEFGQTTAKTLSKGFFFQFPGIGHGASTSTACAARIMVAFVNAPSKQPDSSCIAQMRPPDFALRYF